MKYKTRRNIIKTLGWIFNILLWPLIVISVINYFIVEPIKSRIEDLLIGIENYLVKNYPPYTQYTGDEGEE